MEHSMHALWQLDEMELVCNKKLLAVEVKKIAMKRNIMIVNCWEYLRDYPDSPKWVVTMSKEAIAARGKGEGDFLTSI